MRSNKLKSITVSLTVRLLWPRSETLSLVIFLQSSLTYQTCRLSSLNGFVHAEVPESGGPSALASIAALTVEPVSAGFWTSDMCFLRIPLKESRLYKMATTSSEAPTFLWQLLESQVPCGVVTGRAQVEPQPGPRRCVVHVYA